jgi:biotin-dependent carboxylase-like uncharacterized protein
MSLKVLQGGVLSLLQDKGRIGQHQLGLTTGGPMDAEAFHYLNRLLGNDANSTAIEVSVGGLQLEAQTTTFLCVTGAPMPLRINGEEQPLWSVHPLNPGDAVELGYAQRGCRAYLGVADGFKLAPVFGSTATVVREGIGGLNGNPLAAGDNLPCERINERTRQCLPLEHQPRYHNQLTVRVIPGYQRRAFSRIEKRRFFGAAYTVSERCDRMGYRLEGAPVSCDLKGVLSEGISLGAIQIPPDGNPLVLMNDRQTIGGYPKIGAALSLDLSRLAQLNQGDTVHFAPISRGTAIRALLLAQRFGLNKPLRAVPGG